MAEDATPLFLLYSEFCEFRKFMNLQLDMWATIFFTVVFAVFRPSSINPAYITVLSKYRPCFFRRNDLARTRIVYHISFLVLPIDVLLTIRKGRTIPISESPLFENFFILKR